MINFNEDIISYKSIGNIELAHHVDYYLDEIYRNFDVKVKEYMTVFPFGEKMYGYSLDNGTLLFSADSDGKIISVGCNENYKGKYKNKLYPGITMRELTSLTNSQRILMGHLLLMRIMGCLLRFHPHMMN